MKKIKIQLLTGGILAVALSGFAIYIWGWRLFGFSLCSPPDVSFINNILVTDTEVLIAGEISYEKVYYQGYTYDFEGDTLKVGLRCLHFSFSKAETFDITIPLERPIHKVVLIGNHEEDLLYTTEKIA